MPMARNRDCFQVLEDADPSRSSTLSRDCIQRTRYSLDYVDVEIEARTRGVGIWSGSFDMPWDYRLRRWADASSKAPDPNCPIKGNIDRDGKRIYHTPWGSRFYDKTKINPAKGERWF